MKVAVALHGCDDSTYFTVEDVTPEGLELLNRVAAASDEASDYGCQPSMTVGVEEEDE